MMNCAQTFFPTCGEGDHEVVEGARLNRQLCVWPSAPSVTPSARHLPIAAQQGGNV